MSDNNDLIKKKGDISLMEIIDIVKKYWTFLLSKWLVICIFGFGGASIGLVASLLVKPTYTAHLSFALVEKSGGSGLADLASTLGLVGLNGGNNGTFSGDNLLEIIHSRYSVEKTMLTPVTYNGTRKNLVEVYIDFLKLRDNWSGSIKNPELQKLSYPIGQTRESFTRTQDSVLFSIYQSVTDSKVFTVARKDRKTSIVNVDFSSSNELFSKLFVETLMQQTYLFYRETKTSQCRANINMIQHTADSIKNLYESALYKGAGFSQVNINQAMQFAAVPRIKQENNAQLYGTVYAEVLKNLETLKLDMARETPIIQIIDNPRLPLKKEKLGKVTGLLTGGIIGGFLIVFYLLGTMIIQNTLKSISLKGV